MSSSFCNKCGDYKGDNECNCKGYKVFNPDTMDEGDFVIIYAKTQYSAAMSYIKDDYHQDPCEPSEYRATFFINGKKYSGSAEAEVAFYVEEEEV